MSRRCRVVLRSSESPRNALWKIKHLKWWDAKYFCLVLRTNSPSLTWVISKPKQAVLLSKIWWSEESTAFSRRFLGFRSVTFPVSCRISLLLRCSKSWLVLKFQITFISNYLDFERFFGLLLIAELERMLDDSS